MAAPTGDMYSPACGLEEAQNLAQQVDRIVEGTFGVEHIVGRELVVEVQSIHRCWNGWRDGLVVVEEHTPADKLKGQRRLRGKGDDPS